MGTPASASYIYKDLRTLLDKDVEGEYNLGYCGEDNLDECSDPWQVVDEVSQSLAAEYGEDPNTWLREGFRNSFAPGLIPDTFRYSNRPTFQQLLEFDPAG